MAGGKQGAMAIDYVVPMVFHDDVKWQEDFKAANREYNEADLGFFVRFRSWGTEHLLIRCVRKYMPFVRNIYIILARESQKRPWMDEEGVRIVYHRDIIPEKFLPTFNSLAIEMFLHRIDGLSERFLYGNDDMFPLSPLTEDDFFYGDVPCIVNIEKPLPERTNIFHRACLNGMNFVGREFGRFFFNTIIRGGHSITPMLKSTWEYLWHIGKEDIEASISPFRQSNNFIQWICPWWHYLSGNYVNKAPKRVYVSTKNSIEDVVKAISSEDAGIVCINDNECVSNYMDYGNAVIRAIEEKLK